LHNNFFTHNIINNILVKRKYIIKSQSINYWLISNFDMDGNN
jgi:hypothetical protein